MEVGKPYTISWRVTNTGPVAATGGWVDRLSIRDEYFVLHTQPRLESLPAGASYLATAQVTLPARTPGGAQTLTVRVDDQKQVGEGSETNNAASRPVAVAAADLAVTAFTAPDTVAPGETVRVSWTITNLSTVAATGGWTDELRLQNLPNDPNYYSVVLTRVDVPSLAPSESYILTRDVVIPATASGAKRWVIQTRYGLTQGDMTDANNYAFAAVTVGLPNLVLASAQVGETPPASGTPTPLVAGRPNTFTWTVRNEGPAAANATWYDSFYLSTDATFSIVQDIVVGVVERPSDPVVPGGTYTLTATFTVPDAVGPFTHLFFVANSNRTQVETDPADNSFALPVEYRRATLSDLTVSAVRPVASAVSR